MDDYNIYKKYTVLCQLFFYLKYYLQYKDSSDTFVTLFYNFLYVYVKRTIKYINTYIL